MRGASGIVPDITFTHEPTRIEGHEGAGLVYELGSWVERWVPAGSADGAPGSVLRNVGPEWRKVAEARGDLCTWSVYWSRLLRARP